MISKLFYYPSIFALSATLLALRADDVTPLISVTSPDYCSDIQGDTEIDVSAPGLLDADVSSAVKTDDG
jgi:hypothetical protein